MGHLPNMHLDGAGASGVGIAHGLASRPSGKGRRTGCPYNSVQFQP